MHDLIETRRLGRQRCRGWILVLVLAIVAGGTMNGCAPANPPASVDTKGGSRRKEMADFMKTQPQTGGEASAPAKKKP